MRSLQSLFLVPVFLVSVLLVANVVAAPRTSSALPVQEQPQSAPEPVYELREVTTPPKAVYHPDPEYTEYARKKKINGVVTVLMVVTPEGKVRDVKVTKSLEKSLDKEAIATVSTWKFDPATKDGRPVAVHVSAELTFRLY